MNLSLVLHQPRAVAFFSFVIGLGLAILMFHHTPKTQTSLALPSSEIEGKIIRAEGKCYKYCVEDAVCQISPTK